MKKDDNRLEKLNENKLFIFMLYPNVARMFGIYHLR